MTEITFIVPDWFLLVAAAYFICNAVLETIKIKMKWKLQKAKEENKSDA